MGRVFFSGGKPGMEKPVGFSPVLNENTWAQIRKASDAGIASNLWSVGDTKSIVINGTVGAETFSNLSIDAFILGIDHNASVEGTNRIHFQIGKISGKDVALVDSSYNSSQYDVTGKFTMNTLYTNSGGWNGSYMRKTVLGSHTVPTGSAITGLMACLPSDLRAVMKSIHNYTDNTGGGSDTASYVTYTSDYLWLLSEFEVWAKRIYANSAEQNHQKQYDYYAAGNSKAKYRHNATTKAASWWLRSPDATDVGTFCGVNTLGGYELMSAYYSFGISPCFAV